MSQTLRINQSLNSENMEPEEMHSESSLSHYTNSSSNIKRNIGNLRHKFKVPNTHRNVTSDYGPGSTLSYSENPLQSVTNNPHSFYDSSQFERSPSKVKKRTNGGYDFNDMMRRPSLQIDEYRTLNGRNFSNTRSKKKQGIVGVKSSFSGAKMRITKSTAKLQQVSHQIHESINYESSFQKSNNPHSQKSSICETYEIAPEKHLLDEIQHLLAQSIEMDEYEASLEEEQELGKLKIFQQLSTLEHTIVDEMRQYVDMEDKVCELETDQLKTQKEMEELVNELEQVYTQVEQEKASDPETIQSLCDVDKEIQNEQLSIKNVQNGKMDVVMSLNGEIAAIESDFQHILDTNLNIQILNEKPYITALCLDPPSKLVIGSKSASASQADYLESVEKFTTLKIDKNEYKFDKIINNEEIDYFKTD